MAEKLLKIGWRHSEELWKDIPDESTPAIREFVAVIANIKPLRTSEDIEELLAKELPDFFDQRFKQLTARIAHPFWSADGEFSLVTNRMFYLGLINENIDKELGVFNIVMLQDIMSSALVRYNEHIMRVDMDVTG